MKKNILIVSSNFYAVKTIFNELLNFFDREYNIYFISNNLFATKKNILFFEKLVYEKKIKFFQLFKSFQEKNNFRNSEKEIVKDLDVIINKIKKINFDEILISETILPETKYLLKKLTDKNTKVGFYYPHGLDRDLLYEYENIRADKKLSVNHSEFFKYILFRGNLFSNFFLYLKNSIINFFYFQNLKTPKSFFIGEKIKFFPLFDLNKISKIYSFDLTSEEIIKTVFKKKFDYQIIRNDACNCKNQSVKNTALIILPYFKKKLNLMKRQKKFLEFIKNKLIFLEKMNDFNKIIIKKHPRDLSDFENVFLNFLKSITSKKIELFHTKYNDQIEINFCEFCFVLGTGSLISIASRNCKKINIYTSKELNEIDNGFSLPDEIYDYQYIESKNGSKIDFI